MRRLALPAWLAFLMAVFMGLRMLSDVLPAPTLVVFGEQPAHATFALLRLAAMATCVYLFLCTLAVLIPAAREPANGLMPTSVSRLSMRLLSLSLAGGLASPAAAGAAEAPVIYNAGKVEAAPQIHAAPVASATTTATAVPTPTTTVAPPAPARVAPAANVDPNERIVARGENLWTIAADEAAKRGKADKRAVISYWQRLIAANDDRLDDPDLVFAGQSLRLPDDRP